MSISAIEPDLKSGTILAAFQSVGTDPVARDRLIICVRGLAIISAESFNIPEGKLSRPEDLFLLRLFNALKTTFSETDLNSKFSSGCWVSIVRGLFQTKLQRGKIFLFRDRATSVKNLQNKFAITSLSVSTASLTRKAAPGSFVDFVGYSFLIADQNLLGEPTVSSKSSR